MTARAPVGPEDPAADDRAQYDYRGGTDGNGIAALLRDRIDGEVRFDEYSRGLYATDASIYQATPVGVVFPTGTDDVATVVRTCAEAGVPVLPRGGGTSLAGQSVNEAVVLDFTRHMDDVIEIDPEASVVRTQPGVVLGELNAELAPYGLKFAPDPAWGDKSALGGAIGNNSTGSHSLQYGKTDVYVDECEVVFADGTVATLGEVSLDEIRKNADPDGDTLERVYAEIVRVVDEEADSVETVYPDLKRNVSGYNLDLLLDEARDGTVNVARLLAGSEGTLAVVTEVTVSLEPIPPEKAVALLAYDDLIEAMADVSPILEHDPAAVEVLDGVLLDLARETEAFEDVVTILPEGTRAVLLVEFYAESDQDGRAKVGDLLADRVPDAEPEAPSNSRIGTDAPVRAFAGLEAHDEYDRERFWALRKSGLPILLSRTSDEKHIAFVEDAAVPPENLPDYVSDFQEILDAHDTFAGIYAHAGPGCLHVRPLVSTKTVEGVTAMESIAREVVDLVIEYEGAVSGEHGDGRARSQWNRRRYGDDVWTLFRDLKRAFDPDWLLNPGQVCGDADGHVDMTEHLRFDPEYTFDAGFEPALNWENENGFQGMVELCHGCGGCRGSQDVVGGVMCPTYRAANEEVLSTRGRANMLRRAMSGELPDDPVDDEFVTEVLDLCIGCKGCAMDCPSEVDMAKLKAEVTHAHHQRHGSSRRDRLFADVHRLAEIGSATAPVSNWLPRLPGAGWLAERTLGIARERELPRFRRESLVDWFDERGSRVDIEDATRHVLLVPDAYTNYVHVETGKATVRTFEAAGVHVRVLDLGDLGRPAFSKGFLDRARECAESVVETLKPWIEEGWELVVVEPSDAVMVQSDYLDLLGGDAVEAVSTNTYGAMEYLWSHDLEPPATVPDERLTYHGHCHQKATGRAGHAVAVLRQAGFEVDALDSGCCGMAGSFGYEAEHVSMSEAIAGILYEQVERSNGDRVVAPGTSCRAQLAARDPNAEEPPHPIELLAEALD